MDIFTIEKNAWLHRRRTAYVWQFEYCERRKLAVHQSRKHLYSLRYCRYVGFWVARLMLDEEGNERGWIQDHAYAKPREIEFENGGRYIFP